ncbi:MAG TPA: Mov34/MPN/PAD-1 family protein [Tepidisphaeraceae bacterium]|nr:Mov34/MPN/PAD-1 family protein [Tepidisphaeraceae bacterium]
MTPTAQRSPVDQDISAIATGEWPTREFPLGPRERPTRRCVIFKQSVLNDVRAHGWSAPDIEVCGVLVGNVYTDNIGPFVFIEASIRGNFSAGKNAQVTFTAQTWSHIQDVMDRQYPDMRILGWYHTHPGHGIFLSDMDLFIHKNFFSLPWHLAFVFDPQHQEEGLFAWRTGNMVVESFVVQKDVAPDSTKVARRVPEIPPTPIAAAPQAQGDDDGDGELTRAGVNVGTALVSSDPPVREGAQWAAAQLPAQQYDPPAPAAAAAAAAIAAAIAAPQAQPQAQQHTSAAYPAAAMELKDLANRLQSLEKRQRWTTAALALSVFIAIGWPVALAAYAVLYGGATLPSLSNDPPGSRLIDRLPPAAAAVEASPAAAREPATPVAAPTADPAAAPAGSVAPAGSAARDDESRAEALTPETLNR